MANELARALTSASLSAELSPGIAAMASRVGDGDKATLAGVAVWPAARLMVDEALTEAWKRSTGIDSERTYEEVIIGAGVHAAIYSATRVQRGFPKPLVLERSDRPGGTFALTSRPVFYLNSGNYPGLIGTPGNGEALNYLPGAPLQPSDITSAQYGTNVDIGFITRVTLARYADVITGAQVMPFDDDVAVGAAFRIPLADGREVRALRVIDARGLGDPVLPMGAEDSDRSRVILFPDLLKRFDRDWPLMGLRRVAVIGGGDSGKVAAECLLGIGPQSGITAAALDYVERIDIYGESLPRNAGDWFERERSRYSQLGSFLKTRRLTVQPERGTVVPQPGSVLVNGRPYDVVVVAAGFTPPPITTGGLTYERWPSSSRDLARRAQFGAESYQIGPVAMLPFSEAERASQATVKRAENMAGIFRYATRTAGLASILPAVTS